MGLTETPENPPNVASNALLYASNYINRALNSLNEASIMKDEAKYDLSLASE